MDDMFKGRNRLDMVIELRVLSHRSQMNPEKVLSNTALSTKLTSLADLSL